MNRSFWIIALIILINSLSLTILIPVLYLYGRQFGLNDLQTSLLYSIYSFSQFLATPVLGKLSDRFGRKPLLIICLAGTVVANLIAGLATTAWLLFFARLFDGITGGNNSIAQAVISDVTPEAQRARAFGINGAAFGLGLVLGPVVSLLGQQISLGAAFLISAAMAAIALGVTWLFLPETLEQKANPRTDLFDLGFGNLFKGWMLPKIGILLMINFFIGTTFTIFTYAFQPYFIQVLNQDSQSLTQMFIFLGVLGVIMQTRGITLLMRRFSITGTLFLALFIRSLSFLLMPIWPNIYYFIAVSFLFSIFNSLVQPMVNTLISLNSKPSEQGIALGLNASYLSVSNAIGPVVAGMLIQQTQPETYRYPLYLAGICTFLVLMLAIALRQRYISGPSMLPPSG